METLTRTEVFQAYGVELTRFATSMVGPTEAQDVVSDAMLRSMWSNGWKNVQNQHAYLYRAVASQARMNHRSASRRRERERRVSPVLVSGSAESGLDVWDALGHLSVDERAVVFLTYWEERTEQETAEMVGASERTVRRRPQKPREAAS